VHDRFINKTPDENEIEQKENVEIADIVLPNKIVENVEDDAAEKNDVAEEKDAAVEEKLVVKQKRAYVRKPKIVIEGEESTVKNKTRPTVAKNAKKTLKITEDDV
jgi:hypothetical protein